MSNKRKNRSGYTFELLDQIIFLNKTKGYNGPQIDDAIGVNICIKIPCVPGQ